LEAQACFLLATAYLADGQLALAAAYFEEHYRLARRLHDRLGQSRSCAQLANVHARFGNRETAARFARRYLKLATLVSEIVFQLEPCNVGKPENLRTEL
jgi:hypothetical protein